MSESEPSPGPEDYRYPELTLAAVAALVLSLLATWFTPLPTALVSGVALLGLALLAVDLAVRRRTMERLDLPPVVVLAGGFFGTAALAVLVLRLPESLATFLAILGAVGLTAAYLRRTASRGPPA